MIDIKDLRTYPKKYQDSADARGLKVDIEELLKLDRERGQLIQQIDELRAQLNLKAKPDSKQLQQLRDRKSELERLEKKLTELEDAYQDLLWSVPNLLAADTPKGGEEANRQERTWGDKPKLDFEPQDHVTFATNKGWLDFERGAKVAGHKFYFLKGELFKLEMALKRLALDHLEKEGFTPVEVPHLVTTRIAAGTGFLPKSGERQIYKIEGEDLNLIATAEIPLTGLHADEILPEGDLPLYYAGWSPSYRLEAGAYGKYSKGLYRVHQFNKLEMYIFCPPEQSNDQLHRLVKLEEEIIQALEIPYRVTRTAAGDMGAPHYQKYDLEYWSPVEDEYRELTSASNCTDFQARRLNIRLRRKGQLEFAHTLNATAMAASRTLVAILENHQTAEGKVKIPQALQQYYGGEEL